VTQWGKCEKENLHALKKKREKYCGHDLIVWTKKRKVINDELN